MTDIGRGSDEPRWSRYVDGPRWCNGLRGSRRSWGWEVPGRAILLGMTSRGGVAKKLEGTSGDKET